MSYHGMAVHPSGLVVMLKRREVRVGERLGLGERATCPEQAVRQVEVYKVVGVPVGQGEFSKPEFGVMERWNQNGTIQ